MVLNPVEVLNTITAPVAPAPPAPQPSLEVHQPAPVEQPTQVATAPATVLTQQPKVEEISINTNQLEFNFETSPLSVRIFEALERIEKKLTLIDDRLFALENAKKKD